MTASRRDLHIFRQTQALGAYTGSHVTVEYEVKRFDDVRNLRYRRGYLITCRQRACFPGIPPAGITASTYPNYPILLSTSTAMSSTNTPDSIEIVEYFPRTVNAARGESGGDVSAVDTLAAFAQTMLAAVGADPALVTPPEGTGKVIGAALI